MRRKKARMNVNRQDHFSNSSGAMSRDSSVEDSAQSPTSLLSFLLALLLFPFAPSNIVQI